MNQQLLPVGQRKLILHVTESAEKDIHLHHLLFTLTVELFISSLMTVSNIFFVLPYAVTPPHIQTRNATGVTDYTGHLSLVH